MYRKNLHVLLKLFDIHSYFVLGIGSLKQLFVADLGEMEEMICWKLKSLIADLRYLYCNGLLENPLDYL